MKRPLQTRARSRRRPGFRRLFLASLLTGWVAIIGTSLASATTVSVFDDSAASSTSGFDLLPFDGNAAAQSFQTGSAPVVLTSVSVWLSNTTGSFTTDPQVSLYRAAANHLPSYFVADLGDLGAVPPGTGSQMTLSLGNSVLLSPDSVYFIVLHIPAGGGATWDTVSDSAPISTDVSGATAFYAVTSSDGFYTVATSLPFKMKVLTDDRIPETTTTTSTTTTTTVPDTTTTTTVPDTSTTSTTSSTTTSSTTTTVLPPLSSTTTSPVNPFTAVEGNNLQIVNFPALGENIYGAVLGIEGQQLAAGAGVTLEVHSTPQTIFGGLVGSDGTAAGSAVTPTSLPAGQHVFILTSKAADGSTITEVAAVLIDSTGKILAESPPAQITGFTGADDPRLAIALASGRPIYDPNVHPRGTAGTVVAVTSVAALAASGAAASTGSPSGPSGGGGSSGGGGGGGGGSGGGPQSFSSVGFNQLRRRPSRPLAGTPLGARGKLPELAT